MFLGAGTLKRRQVSPPSRYFEVPASLSPRLDRLKACPASQSCSNLIVVLAYTSSIAYALKLLPWNTATHVRRYCSRQQGRLCQLIDPVFPFCRRFGSGIDVLQTLAVDKIDGIANPTALNFDTAGSIGQ